MEKWKNINLAVSIIISSIILGIFFYSAREQNNTVKVVGYSISAFEADIVKWRFNITETVHTGELPKGYKNLNNKIEDLKSIIYDSNLDSLEVLFNPVMINEIYNQTGITQYKKLTQEVVITTKSISKIEDFSTNPSKFIEKNILFEYSKLDYYYTKLDYIKKELLGKAIVNAKERATEILSAVGNNVGDLVTARSGVFQITEPLSTEVAGYGIHSTSTKKKNIKVTVSAEFLID